MIRHCVFIRFRAEVSQAERAAIFAEIAALKERLPGFLAVHIGANVSPEAGMDKGYSDGFIVDFADATARDVYLEDPEHRKIGGKIVAAAEGGVQGVFVYDLSIPD
ncbi:MAG TPA: Dabb family protein [Sinorhizobium sp.]|nr:Dabb family protein [Sinorhizobium sp.]